MNGERAEGLAVLGLRLLAASFAVVGALFLFAPDGVGDVLTDFGEVFSDDFAVAPDTQQHLWLSLGFAYMVVITGICLVAQADVVRYRPLILVLAAGKAASSLTSLAFFVFEDNVFAYLLNFLVDGSLVLVSLFLWSLAGRAESARRGATAAPS